MAKKIRDLQMAQRRRFTVEFEQGSFWLEYAPGLYSEHLADRVRTRLTTSAEKGNQLVLTELLTAWELAEALTPDAIRRLNITTLAVIVTALFADLTTYLEELKARVVVMPQPFEPPPTV